MIKSNGEKGNGKRSWTVDWAAVLTLAVQSIILVGVILATYYSTVGEIKTMIAVHENRIQGCERSIDDLKSKIIDRVDCQVCHHKTKTGK